MMPDMKARLVGTLVVVVGTLLSLRVEATCGGGGGGGMGGMAPGGGGSSSAPPRVYQVPWKFVGPEAPAPGQGLVLYWFPASLKETKESALATSRDLSL